MSATHPETTKFSQYVHTKNVHNRILLPGVETRHWWVKPGNTVSYLSEEKHTLSLYLEGGSKNFRADKPDRKGAPGKICLMPQSQDSQWIINGTVEFVHLYFSDERLKQFAAQCFDMDVRLVDISALLFVDDAQLRTLFFNHFLAQQHSLTSPLKSEEALHELLFHLLSHYNGNATKNIHLKGGLSACHRIKVRDYIHDNVSQKLCIDDMAKLTNLSPFHFARMFKLSLGLSPTNYVTLVRINLIKQQLQRNKSLADITYDAGFSQQSHMTQFFKKLTGLTPSVYRELCGL